jgi:DNA polymerase III alpha subunit
VVRNAGKHAGGVVIAPTKITDFAPLYCDDEGITRSPSSTRTTWSTRAW